MHDCADEFLVERWFAIGSVRDVPPRHIHRTMLLGEELIVWRADDGTLNAWEDRCPHRGVRLSLGINLGEDIRCQYHGMRYRAGTGQCSFIPAHPRQPPARALRVRAYRCMERHALLWATLGEAPSLLPPASDGESIALRSMPVGASAPLVAEALIDEQLWAPSDGETAGRPAVEVVGPFALVIHGCTAAPAADALLLLQPVDATRSIVHGCLRGEIAGASRQTALRYFNDRLAAIRDATEAAGRTLLSLDSTPTAAAAAHRNLIAGRIRYGVTA